jgi:hypothetical protein
MFFITDAGLSSMEEECQSHLAAAPLHQENLLQGAGILIYKSFDDIPDARAINRLIILDRHD